MRLRPVSLSLLPLLRPHFQLLRLKVPRKTVIRKKKNTADFEKGKRPKNFTVRFWWNPRHPKYLVRICVWTHKHLLKIGVSRVSNTDPHYVFEDLGCLGKYDQILPTRYVFSCNIGWPQTTKCILCKKKWILKSNCLPRKKDSSPISLWLQRCNIIRKVQVNPLP